MKSINIYCDESGHLEHDQVPVMVLGALWCDSEKTREIAKRLREIKVQHGLPAQFEVKWSKVSPAKKEFYLRLLDYFFDDDDLHFRAIVIPDKTKLDHRFHNQSHDTWYYKMYFLLLTNLILPDSKHRIYLDIKDTRGSAKVRKLHEILSNKHYDFNRDIVQRVQTVRSHEVEHIQLADLLIGAVSYANRGLEDNEAKVALVQRMRERSGLKLTASTLPTARKVNIFIWTPQERG
ncbi:hypothetical protein Mterra_01750 [Calidithermus terrae]|uniref:DUF3800 domain-containing protein n=1 Tax=Calidithermus terrae TaxID=1408545 RepID=A0A399EST0_9DEIN|nr:DUF3800 domain-containing protein [Calidithermus terrae]RIH85261.1 hypothetical protein Mterra_01750 [Calidithermus terrae]